MTHPTISDDGTIRMTTWPAFTYIERVDGSPISVDKGGRHLGEPSHGVAVPFPTRRHGELHKHFGICDTDEGPKAYGKAVSLTSQQRPHDFLASARIGGLILYRGKQYRIERAPNDNITLLAA